MVVGLNLQSVQASHPWSWHIGSVHSGYSVANEAICVDDNADDMSVTTELSKISGALWQENPSSDWDSLSAHGDGFRIFFYQLLGGNCDSLTSGERDAVDIEYWVWDGNEAGYPCAFPASCVPTSGFTGAYTQYGHTDYAKVKIHLYDEFLDGASYYRHQVNHETGHALGFNDGGATGNPPSCPPSVMHTSAYSNLCTDLSWPTTGDINAAIEIAVP